MLWELKKVYLSAFLPSVFGFALVCWAKRYGFFEISPTDGTEIVGPFIFILGMAATIAFPIFYRALFAHRSRDLKSVSAEKLFKFERTLIYVVMITPYLALIAYLLDLPRFYTASTVLAGLYSVYYFYPSKRRVAFERRIFRAK